MPPKPQLKPGTPEYNTAVEAELARRKSPNFLRLWPHLNAYRQERPELYYEPSPKNPDFGYALGTRYGFSNDPRWSVNIRANMPPRDFLDTLIHEYSHIAVDKQPSQNWAYIMSKLRPTDRLSELLTGTYPRMLFPEEGLLRYIGVPDLPVNTAVTRYPGVLTPEQKAIIPYLERFLKYGENAGSIWGPELPEEYIGKKGVALGVPPFKFNPSLEDRRRQRPEETGGALSSLLTWP